jgi:hypothetical protein
MTSTPSPRDPLRPQTLAEARRLALIAKRRSALIAKLEATALYARDGSLPPVGRPAARPRLRSRRRGSGG